MSRRGLFALGLLLLLAACGGTGKHRVAVTDREHRPAVKPVVNEVQKRSGDWRPKVYTVQRGDTLYSIAFNHGMDYRELAELNEIQNPSIIQVGQELRLFVGAEVPTAPPEVKPVVSLDPPLKTEPKAIKLPYSIQSQAMLESGGRPLREKVTAPVPVPPMAASLPKVEAKSQMVKVAPEPTEDSGSDERLEWVMPTRGRVIGEFSESASRKGIDIAGKQGQAVLASAAGRVVYSGSGLRGYGKLIIIKHDNTFLSAYAHNDKILVKERESVRKGQKIAEMGDSDADQVKLHFEIRKFGKPVDPLAYLPHN